jgi:ABC-2 type transport system permease protein
VKAEIFKWWQTIKISWSTQTAYRLNFFLQIIGPALVFFFVKYNLWSSIYAGDKIIKIEGYDFSSMINYHVWAFIVGLLGQGHNSMNLSEDIRLGRISTYLIYPFDFWEFHCASFIAFQILQIFVTIFSIAILYFMGIIEFHGTLAFFHGYLYTLFVSIFWFCLQFFTGILAFWLEETWIIRVMFLISTSFFSGAIIPLEFFPNQLVSVLNYTPFPYLTYYPIKIFLGQLTDLWAPYGILFLWILILVGINTLVWKRGIRLYAGAGM